jgi:kynurenine formamidase
VTPTLATSAAISVVALTLSATLSTRMGDQQPGSPARPTHVVDLTHTLDQEFPYIPVPGITFPFKLTPIASLEKDGVAANRWEIHEHIGTQIDAPNHFVAGGAALDALPVRSLVVPLAVIDISARAHEKADSVVTVDDVASWERAHGRLPADAAVFMYSGWETRIADRTAFVNADASNTMHFPGFSVEAAEFLATERQIAGLGVDTLSIDPGYDKKYRTHRSWLRTGKWAVEAIANLRDVPPSRATVFVGATKVKDATGGPVRLIAVW